MSPFWRMDDPVLGQDGSVIWPGMWPHQRKWWCLPNKFKALVTGYGGGKTFIGGKRCISGAILNAPAPSLAISPTYDMARLTIVETITDLLEERKIPHHYNKNEKEFSFRYMRRKCKIIVRSGDKPKTLKGPNIGQAWIDEPFIQDKEVLEQITARVRNPKAGLKEILITGTPESLNWGYDICQGDERENYDLGLVQAPTFDNRAIGQDYYDTLKATYTEKALEAFGHGQFINLATGTVYYGFSIARNIQEREAPEGAILSVGMDFNVNPMSATVFWTKGEHVHYLDEIELADSHTAGMCSRLKVSCPEAVTVYPDASGAQRSTASSAPGESDLSILRDNGFRVRVNPSNPLIIDRENAVNKKLEDGTITISPKCKKLKQYLTQYTHENRKKEQGKAMSHLIDAFGYPIAYLFPIKRPSVPNRRVSYR